MTVALTAAAAAFAIYVVLVLLPLALHPDSTLADVVSSVGSAFVYAGGAVLGAAIALALTGDLP